MHEVEVLFMVTRTGGGTREERIKTRVDTSTLSAASGDLGRTKLDGWAKQFFPADKKAQIISIKRLICTRPTFLAWPNPALICWARNGRSWN